MSDPLEAAVAEVTAETRLSGRGPGFGIPSWKVDGMDPLAVHLAMQEALEHLRQLAPSAEVVQALASAPHTLSGTLEVGGQEHFYLEGQVAYALPQEQNQWLIHSSTQHPGESP